MGTTNWQLVERVRALSDGRRTSTEIASALGINSRHVRKIWSRHGLQRPNCGAQRGERNASYNGGRRINHNGYVMVTAPTGHPYAKIYGNKKTGWIFEHRLVLEQSLGRYLLPEEKVDHIDGLTLHNHPDNLRLFSSNREHLQETLRGIRPNHTEQGRANMRLRHHQPEALIPFDIHRQRTKAGVTRLRQILLAALKLGTDSPYLSGSSRHLAKAGIALSSRSTIERALVDLCEKWGWPPPQL